MAGRLEHGSRNPPRGAARSVDANRATSRSVRSELSTRKNPWTDYMAAVGPLAERIGGRVSRPRRDLGATARNSYLSWPMSSESNRYQ